MKKPKMRSLTIQAPISVHLSQTIFIEALTEEAEIWMKKNTQEFGCLYQERDKEWGLLVHNGYNRDEVMAYLIDKWDSERWPEEIGEVVETEIQPSS